MDINALINRENRYFPQISQYTYQDMENDLHIFSRIFEKIAQINSLGDTLDGRKIYHVRVGAEEAENRFFVFAGIHGREYMTCQLVMEQLSKWCLAMQHQGQRYKGHTYSELMKNCAIHVVPMANPDGVTISQFGAEGMQSEEMRKKVWEIAARDGARMPWKNYFRMWKSNAEGVDVNRNFDALWETYVDGVGRPSREKYKGSFPGSTREAQALIQLTEKEKFCRTISYHSSGAVIYWSFGQKGELAEKTETFAGRIAKVTDYVPDENYEELDPAGYKDWALLEMGIPSITIEIGRADSPLPSSCYKKVLRENRFVWEEMILDRMLEKEKKKH